MENQETPDTSQHTDDTSTSAGPAATEGTVQKKLVNPVSLRGSFAEIGEEVIPISDISFLRVNLDLTEHLDAAFAEGPFAVRLHLERHQMLAEVTLAAKGANWARLAFTKLVPSAGAHLRAFLSPKRVGESIVEDWRGETLRHYHGLNESELWFDTEGQILFSYIDGVDCRYQFVLRLPESKGALQVGRMERSQYIRLEDWGDDLVLLPLNDRDVFQKLSECRDIVTNFRPSGQHEYQLKQRLLKVISEALYSTGRKVAMAPPPRVAPKPPQVSSELMN